MNTLTKSRLHELLSYSTETGEFTWLKLRNGNAKAGQRAGSLYNNGYVLIGIDRKYHLAHRLAWLFVHGEWPLGRIDHINGDKTDNRIENLRSVSNSVNMQNQRKPMANNKTSGLLGVCWDKSYSRWKAQIGLNGKTRYLGSFRTAQEAHQAYLAAKRQIHEGCTI